MRYCANPPPKKAKTFYSTGKGNSHDIFGFYRDTSYRLTRKKSNYVSTRHTHYATLLNNRRIVITEWLVKSCSATTRKTGWITISLDSLDLVPLASCLYLWFYSMRNGFFDVLREQFSFINLADYFFYSFQMYYRTVLVFLCTFISSAGIPSIPVALSSLKFLIVYLISYLTVSFSILWFVVQFSKVSSPSSLCFFFFW